LLPTDNFNNVFGYSPKDWCSAAGQFCVTGAAPHNSCIPEKGFRICYYDTQKYEEFQHLPSPVLGVSDEFILI